MNRYQFFTSLPAMSPAERTQVQNAYWLSKNAHRVTPERQTGGTIL